MFFSKSYKTYPINASSDFMKHISICDSIFSSSKLVVFFRSELKSTEIKSHILNKLNIKQVPSDN